MRLFSFSRATFGSNQKATAVSRIRDAEKIEDDWHSSPHGPHQPSDGGLYTTGDQSATQGDAAFDPFGTTSEPTLGGHGVVNPEPVVRPHIFALSSLAEDSAFVVRKVDGGIGETPVPPIRALVSRKRSSRSSFFAFSSKRRSHHGSPIIQMPQSQQTPRLKAQIADPSALPSPLRTDNEDYYYCNSPFPPSQPSSPVTPRLDTLNFFPPRRKRSVRSQSHQITLDSDSQKSSPINYHSPSHSHPFSVSANALRSTISSDLPPVQLAGLSEERIRPGGGGLGNEESGVLLFPIPPQRLPLTTRDNRAAAEGKLPQARGLLRTSFSVPNLHSAMRATPHQASMKASGPTTKSKDLLLTAGSWCDMLIFPRPRLKANQEPGTTKQFVITPPCTPIPGDGVGGIAPTLSSRPDTNSATLVAEHVPPNAQSPPVPLEARIISPALNAPPDEEVMPSADNPHGPDFEAELSLPTPHPTVSQYVFYSRKRRLFNG
ncbi:hypothetical protein ID866_7153 [Astraeus odoratus]|nr:hypothetical protein ID866_7153 [Astraeus odoratus]